MSSEVGSGPQADICSLSVRCPLLPKSQLAGQLGLWNGDTERFLELITNSYLVGACTGRSAGIAPLRMRSR